MKAYIAEICATMSVSIAGLMWWRQAKNDVPESTKDYVAEKIKEHEVVDDTNRERRSDAWNDKMTVKIDNMFDNALDRYDARREKTETLEHENTRKDVRLLSSQFAGVHKRLDSITENCINHKKGKE